MHCFLRCRHGSGSTEPHAAPRSLRALPPNRVPLFFLQCVHDCTSGIDSCNKTTFGTAHILLRECVHSLCRCWPRCEYNTGYLHARYCSPLFLKKKFPNAMMSQLWFLSFVSDLLFCCFQYLLQISDTFPPLQLAQLWGDMCHFTAVGQWAKKVAVTSCSCQEKPGMAL